MEGAVIRPEYFVVLLVSTVTATIVVRHYSMKNFHLTFLPEFQTFTAHGHQRGINYVTDLREHGVLVSRIAR